MKILRSLSLSFWVLSALCISNLVDWADVDGETLNVTQHAYVVLENEAFPQHSVRIKPVTGFCDPTVDSYVGYIDMGARHLFFYYFESRNDPAIDDVVLWLNGGPGASASLGLFMELGPCTIMSDTETEYNKYSWNSNSNMLFIDQPVGVAFSYAEFGETVGTTEEAAKDIAAFLAIFFDSMDGLKGRALHIAGESYGGRYVPLFAAEVYDQNRYLVQQGMAPLNLVSAIIGNGCSDIYHTITSYYDMQCSTSAGPPIQSISACTQMKSALPRCQRALQRHCEDTFDMINCPAAQSFCADMLHAPFLLTGKSLYDMRTECIGEVTDTLCYPATKQIADYLNLPSTRLTLGIDPSYPNISMVGWAVNAAFSASGDVYKSSTLHIAALLDHGVRVLVYAGKYDLACNFVANDRVTRDLEWHGTQQFVAQPLRNWVVDGQPAGETRAFGGLTFATVRDAGHQVPHDRPVESLALINRWLSDRPL
ncbi:serine carboxypeptidase [Mycena albidolilacea]|uniref:Carboxypeptidase n=1 Tax=Mycena albidolilacea TaxID=1033008 RepID=A0AAD7A3N4_9AGAR|nr:serine carboxypeptidase [Mycena albidolilacea]